jgi:hypothetical protein
VQKAWDHRCDAYPVEVILNGLPYGSSLSQQPIASFFIRQKDGTLRKYYDFALNMELEDRQFQHFTLISVDPSISPDDAPTISEISYDYTNNTFSAFCGSNRVQSDSCATGSFDERGPLSIVINDTQHDTSVRVQTLDQVWMYPQGDDAPSFILTQVDSTASDDLGEEMPYLLMTAVTHSVDGRCTLLKVCSQETSIETLVPLGMALMRQNQYAFVCTNN